jgi:Flp pilus assembly protein TadG
MRFIGGRQPAQAIAFAAVALIAMVGAVGFVIDIGFFLEGRRELQNAADSAALAGVIYLPNCVTDTGGPCGAGANATDAVAQVVNQNGPIARQLCGHPTNSVGPIATVTPATYTPDPAQPANFYYQLTVSLRCDPGFSFGRIIVGMMSEQIQASATAVIGGLGSVNCAAPLAAVQFPNTVAGDGTNWGYTPGLKFNSLPAPTGNGSDPILLDNQASSYIGPAPVPPGECLECGDFFEVCLDAGTCNDAPTVQGWFSGVPCLKLNLQSNNLSDSPTGFKNSSVFQGLADRWCPPNGTNCLSGNEATCLQTVTQVVNTSTWTVLPGQSSSHCIMQVMILSYASVLPCTNGPCSNLTVIGFATAYIYKYSGNTPKHFEGVFIHANTVGDVTFFQNSGTYTIRLIR